MSARTKQNIWWALERFGMPTIFCMVLWVGFRNDAEEARADQREFNTHMVETTGKVASVLAENNELRRQLIGQQQELERAIERQTVSFERQTLAFEKLIERITKQ